jgi:hypothetical protein
MALTVPFKAVAFEAFTFDFNGSRLTQKEFFLISAVFAFTKCATGFS